MKQYDIELTIACQQTVIEFYIHQNLDHGEHYHKLTAQEGPYHDLHNLNGITQSLTYDPMRFCLV